MKTIKMLSMAVVALIMGACSNIDDPITDEVIVPEQSPEEITVTATLDAMDDTSTRAFNGSTSNTVWKVDDEVAILFEYGEQQVKRVATVTEVDDSKRATIEFTIPAELPVTNCTLVYPASAAKEDNTGVKAYADMFATQDGKLNDKYDVRVGTGSVWGAYDQGNQEMAPRRVKAEPGISAGSLTPQFTLFYFTAETLADHHSGSDPVGDPLHPSKLVISDGSGNVITTINPEKADGAYPQKFWAVLPPASSGDVWWFEATTDENQPYINKATLRKDIKAGSKWDQYLFLATFGDLMGSDGKFYLKENMMPSGVDPIGVIAYIGNDNFSENGTTVDESTFVGHGLVLALKNAASDVKWSTLNTGVLEFGEDAFVTKKDDLFRTTDVSGYSNTKTLATKSSYSTDFATDYPAAHAAWTYTGLTAPTGTTGWFLPSAQQWVKIMEGLGELNESVIKWQTYFDSDHTCAGKWDEALAKAGSGNYDSMSGQYLWYWSSSESAADDAAYLFVSSMTDSGLFWGRNTKNVSYVYDRVRPVLAF